MKEIPAACDGGGYLRMAEGEVHGWRQGRGNHTLKGVEYTPQFIVGFS